MNFFTANGTCSANACDEPVAACSTYCDDHTLWPTCSECSYITDDCRCPPVAKHPALHDLIGWGVENEGWAQQRY